MGAWSQAKVLAALAAALFASPAAARTTDEELARAHFTAGMAEYDAKHWAAASREFLEAYRITHSAELLFNLGLCYEKLDDPGRASAYLGRYLAEVPGAPERRDLEVKLRAIAPRVATVTVRSSAGAEITIDDVPVGRAPIPPQLLSAGRHRVEARRSGFLPGSTELDFPGGVGIEVRVEPRPRSAGDEAPELAPKGPPPRDNFPPPFSPPPLDERFAPRDEPAASGATGRKLPPRPASESPGDGLASEQVKPGAVSIAPRGWRAPVDLPDLDARRPIEKLPDGIPAPELAMREHHPDAPALGSGQPSPAPEIDRTLEPSFGTPAPPPPAPSERPPSVVDRPAPAPAANPRPPARGRRWIWALVGASAGLVVAGGAVALGVTLGGSDYGAGARAMCPAASAGCVLYDGGGFR